VSKELIEKHRLNFDILQDQALKVAETYGLRFTVPDYLNEAYKGFGIDLEGTSGDPAGTLPLPARFVIDPKGMIRYARVNADYRFRPEPSETIAALRAIASE